MSVVARASADSHLARLSGPRAASRLGSPDADVRLATAHALGDADVGEPVAATVVLAARLELERDDGVRREIFRALARRAMPQAIEALLAAPRTPAEQRVATLALAAFDDPRALAALVERLGPEVTRDAAVRAIGRVGARALPAVLHALRQPAQAVGAARALGELRDVRAVPELARAARQRDPIARAAALDALGALGDERARPTLLAHLRDPEAGVAAAAARALGRVGRREDARALGAVLASADVRARDEALEALAHLDPAGVAVLLEHDLVSGESDRRASAERIVLASRDPAMAPALRAALGRPETAREAASALAALDAGAGLDVLLASARDAGPTRAAAAVGLALLARRFAGRIAPDRLTAARAAVRAATAGDPTERALALRALAIDPFVAPWVVRALSSRAASRRASAARAAELLGDDSLAPAVARALELERESEARRRMLSALSRLVASGSGVRAAPSAPAFADAETGPEAMALVATVARADAHPLGSSRELVRALHGELRSTSPRARAGAARALAATEGRAAWRALVEALDDDDALVRLAVARSLAVVAPADAVVPLRAALRVETDALVEATLADALAGATGEAPRLPLDACGPEPFDALVVRRAGEPPPPPLDVVLPDGRWLRLHVPASGEIFVPDLPVGALDLRFAVLP